MTASLRVCYLTVVALLFAWAAEADPYDYFYLDSGSGLAITPAHIEPTESALCAWWGTQSTIQIGPFTFDILGVNFIDNRGTDICELTLSNAGSPPIVRPLELLPGTSTCPDDETFDFAAQACDAGSSDSLTLQDSIIASAFAVVILGLGWLVGGADGRGA